MNDKLKESCHSLHDFLFYVSWSLHLVIIDKGGAIGVIRTNLVSPHASYSSSSYLFFVCALSFSLSLPHPLPPFPSKFQMRRLRCTYITAEIQLGNLHAHCAADRRLGNEYMCLVVDPWFLTNLLVCYKKKCLCYLYGDAVLRWTHKPDWLCVPVCFNCNLPVLAAYSFPASILFVFISCFSYFALIFF